MGKQDIRWKQRLGNYARALKKLEDVIDRIDLDSQEEVEGELLSDLEKEGVIQRFEYVHELAWNVMKDYLEYQGNPIIRGSRDAIREAFRLALIEDGEGWMDMIKSRNQTSHTYNEEVANQIFLKIVNSYYRLFKQFHNKMRDLDQLKNDDPFSKEV